MSSNMRPLARIAPLAAVLAAATFTVPAVAQAKTAPVKGQIVGTPYLADATRTAVPVLLSKETARKAKLSSPLGVVIVPRRKAVSMPGGTVLPGRLRLGDRFIGTANVTTEARKATYPRMTLKGLKVTRRSKQLSTQELEEQLAKTRKDLTNLTSFVNQLATYTQRGFSDLNSRVNTLAADLAATKADLASLRSEVTKVASDLAAARTDLLGKIDLVRSDLQPQITAVADGLATLNATIGACGSPGTILDKLCTLQTAVTNLDPANLGPLTDRVTQLSGALTSVVSGLTGLTLTGDLPATLTTEITDMLTGLSGLTGTVAGLSTQVGGLNTTVSSLSSGLATVTALVGGVDVGALKTTVDGITTQIGGLATTESVDQLAASLAGAQTQVSGILSYLSPSDSNLATTADNTLNTMIQPIQDQLTTVCTTWRTLLSGTTLTVTGLTSTLLSVTGTTSPLPTLPGC